MKVYGRLHARLKREVVRARKENLRAKGKDVKLQRRYSEAAKELYAYVRLMELCQMLSKDVTEMHSILGALTNMSIESGEKPN